MAAPLPGLAQHHIRQLLDMTSRIPDDLYQPAFDTTFAADPATRFTAARLVSYVVGLPLGPAGYHYTNTDYILAQMIIEKVTHDSYADQLTRRISRLPTRPGQRPPPVIRFQRTQMSAAVAVPRAMPRRALPPRRPHSGARAL
jgi:D-alanyl-D-alanine carboxypeptidase